MYAPHESTSAEGLTSEAIARLVDSHARFLAFLERRVGARETAEEILQEAYARALQRGDALRAGESEYAEIVRAVELQEQPLSDYAQRTGITGNNAAVRLHRAREVLFKRLVQSCGTCATHGCLDCHCESTKGTPGCG